MFIVVNLDVVLYNNKYIPPHSMADTPCQLANG